MDLDELARSLHAYKTVDVSRFQRSARVLQSLWREERGYKPGEHAGYPLGSRLPMPWAKDELANFITPTVRDVVRAEVLNKEKAADKLYGKPRIFNDLLSSQPLCFNLFGELSYNLDLASLIISDLTNRRISRVASIEFEISPGRSNPSYLNDRSAFDVFIRCTTADGGQGFIGIEIKYHENLLGQAGKENPRYDEVADLMGCFVEDRSSLKCAPLEQIWRDHLLAGITRIQDRYDEGLFVTLYPKDNSHVSRALEQYRRQLTSDNSIHTWTLEAFIAAIRHRTRARWVDVFEDRYLAFDKIARKLDSAD